MLNLFTVFVVLIIIFMDLWILIKSSPTQDATELIRVKRIINGRYAGLDDRVNHYNVFAFGSILHGKAVPHCTGTFIAKNIILTTATCCEHLKPTNPIKIYSSGYTLKATVSQVHLGPLYQENISKCNNDLGVIQLNKNINSIIPSPLGFDYVVSCGEVLYQYGYGEPNPNIKHAFHKMSDKVKVFTGKVIKCGQLTESITIEGMDWGRPSWGDFGGPVFNKEGQIVGVHTCGDGIFSHSARISYHKAFLLHVLRQNESKISELTNSTTKATMIYKRHN